MPEIEPPAPSVHGSAHAAPSSHKPTNDLPQMVPSSAILVQKPDCVPPTANTFSTVPLVAVESVNPQTTRLKRYNIAVIVLSILSLTLGSLYSCLCSVPAVVLAFLGREDYNFGRKRQGKIKTIIALVLSIVGLLIVVLILVVVVVFQILAYPNYASRPDHTGNGTGYNY